MEYVVRRSRRSDVYALLCGGGLTDNVMLL